jgi:hypothetical protein
MAAARLPREVRDAINAAIGEWVHAAHRRAPQLAVRVDRSAGRVSLVTLVTDTRRRDDAEPAGEAFRLWLAQARHPALPVVQLSRRRPRGSGIDQRQHPCDPHARGRPVDPAIAAIRRAVERLIAAGYARAAARRVVCDEILDVLRDQAPRVLDVPTHVLEDVTTPRARQARLRRWVLTRWRAVGI